MPNAAGHFLTAVERALLSLESWLVGPLRPDARHNIRVEIGWAAAYGVFATALAFVPVVLRQLGAPAGWLAFYSSSTYFGSVASWAGLAFFRPGQVKRRMTAMWLVSRGLLVLVALVSGYPGLLLLVAVFWLLEGLPSPAYTAIVQRVYPVEDRGRVMSVTRVAMALPMLALGPVAGWLLDSAGYRVLFPLAGLVGMLGALIFSRLRVDETALQVRVSGAPTGLRRLFAQDRRFTLYLVGVLLFGLGSLIPVAIVPIVQVDRLRLSYTAIGWLNLSMAVSRTVSYVFWGRMTDRWGGVRCMQAAFAINMLVLAPYAIATTQGMGAGRRLDPAAFLHCDGDRQFSHRSRLYHGDHPIGAVRPGFRVCRRPGRADRRTRGCWAIHRRRPDESGGEPDGDLRLGNRVVALGSAGADAGSRAWGARS